MIDRRHKAEAQLVAAVRAISTLGPCPHPANEVPYRYIPTHMIWTLMGALEEYDEVVWLLQLQDRRLRLQDAPHG